MAVADESLSTVPQNVPTTANTIVSTQAAVAFPLTSGVIAAAWQVSGLLYAPLKGSAWVPFVIAVVLGIIYFYMNTHKGMSRQELGMLFLATVGNIITLTAAAVGISSAVPS